MSLDSVAKALEATRQGRMVVMVDDEDRENEGDLVLAAEKVTPELINFMAMHARGLICLALTENRLRQLDLPQMVDDNTSQHATAFTVSIEASEGVTTGISAADRSHTIKVAVAPDAEPADLVKPGHVFPLRAVKGGVLVRSGHTEGAVDLARMAGLSPAGVICEIMNPDGTMARLPDLKNFAKEHDLPIISIEQLIEHRVSHESLVRKLVTKGVTHPVWGDVTLHAFGTSLDGRQHLAVVKGDILDSGDVAPLIRVHSGYPLSSVFGDLFSSDRSALNAALMRLEQEPRAVLLCLDQGTAPVSLAERIEGLGEEGASPHSSTPAQRNIGVGAQILRELGLTDIRLLTNNPRRLKGLEGFGLSVRDVVSLDVGAAHPLPKPKVVVG